MTGGTDIAEDGRARNTRRDVLGGHLVLHMPRPGVELGGTLLGGTLRRVLAVADGRIGTACGNPASSDGSEGDGRESTGEILGETWVPYRCETVCTSGAEWVPVHVEAGVGNGKCELLRVG